MVIADKFVLSSVILVLGAVPERVLAGDDIAGKPILNPREAAVGGRSGAWAGLSRSIQFRIARLGVAAPAPHCRQHYVRCENDNGRY